MKTYFLKLKNSWILLLVTLIGAALRFYRLRDMTTFGGDQGVDYQIVANMILSHKPTLLGPVTHVGIYLGPLYYYLLTPVFLLFRFDPIAAPALFAVLGTISVSLMFVLAREFLSPMYAFFTALLYAVSPVILESSRAPSQPHLIPFLSVLLLMSMVRIIEKKATKWDAVSIGIVLGSAIQFHYLAFPMYLFTIVLVVGTYLLSDLENRKCLSMLTAYCLLLTALLLAPWLLFELRHQFFITRQILNYLASGDISFSLTSTLSRVFSLAWFSVDRLVARGSQFIIAAIVVLSLSGVILRRREGNVRYLLLYVFLNVIGISLYIDPFSNHYISALYPALILFPVIGIARIFTVPWASFILVSLVLLNASGNDFYRHHGYTMPDELTTSVIQKAAATIHQDTPPNQYEVANLLDGDTRAQPYRYLLTFIYRQPPLPVDAYPNARTLYVIGRNEEELVVNNSVWEIASLSPKVLSKKWPLSDTIVLYRFDRVPL